MAGLLCCRLKIVKKGRKNWKDWSVLRGITISEKSHSWASKKKWKENQKALAAKSTVRSSGNVKTKIIAIGRHRKEVPVDETHEESGDGMILLMHYCRITYIAV